MEKINGILFKKVSKEELGKIKGGAQGYPTKQYCATCTPSGNDPNDVFYSVDGGEMQPQG